MFDYLKYTLLPILRVRFTYWWWIIKYGGKRNIPPELVFQQMEKSFASMRDNLGAALHSLPESLDKGEVKKLLELIREVDVLGEEITEVKIKKREEK